MLGSLTNGQAKALNNSNPAAQNALLGDNLRAALNQGFVNPEFIRYLDGTNTTDGDGLSWETAFNNWATAITAMNNLSILNPGKHFMLKVAPDFYTITENLVLTANNCYIMGVGAPEDTVLFGSGLTGDLFTQQGSYNIYRGLTFYNHKNTKAALTFDDVGGGGANGGFSIVENCQFSPQAVDGQNYGIYIKGANFLEIRNCRFQATKQAGIYFVAGVGNPVRTRIQDCLFIGCNNGVEIAAPAYNIVLNRNIYVDGSEAAGENYNKSVLTTAAHTAGSVEDVDGKHGGTNQAGSYTNGGGGGSLTTINPAYSVSI